MNLPEIKRIFPVLWNAFRRNGGALGYTPNYKVCTLHLSHVFGDPTPTIVENTLGATITWVEEVQGIYVGILSANVLTEGKTCIFYNTFLNTGYTFHIQRNNTNLIGISYRDAGGIGAAGFEADIQILVYN